jgi:hypothetical protein
MAFKQGRIKGMAYEMVNMITEWQWSRVGVGEKRVRKNGIDLRTTKNFQN